MKNIHQWLGEYGVSHKNETNKTIHWICVPLIFFSVTGFFFSVQLPYEIYSGIKFNLAIPLLVGVTFYYFALSRTLWLGMLLFSLLCFAACFFIEQAGFQVWLVSTVVFVIAWAGQFYGHSIEGKKPSFFKDLQFLMIGPAWLMSFIYKKIGIAL